MGLEDCMLLLLTVSFEQRGYARATHKITKRLKRLERSPVLKRLHCIPQTGLEIDALSEISSLSLPPVFRCPQEDQE